MAVRSSRKAKRLSWEMRAKGPVRGRGASVGVGDGGPEQPTRTIKVIVISISRSQKLAGDRQIRRPVAGSGDPARASRDLLSMHGNLGCISRFGVYNRQMSPFSLTTTIVLDNSQTRKRGDIFETEDCLRCPLDRRRGLV